MYIPTLVDFMVVSRANTIDSKSEEWHNKEETEQHANVLITSERV
jgi:hypothetical protein